MVKTTNSMQDHMLKHLQLYKIDCPIEDCEESYGGLESLRRHLNKKHKKQLSVMEKEEPDLWKKSRTPTPCTKEKPYHCESLENKDFVIHRDKGKLKKINQNTIPVY